MAGTREGWRALPEARWRWNRMDFELEKKRMLVMEIRDRDNEMVLRVRTEYIFRDERGYAFGPLGLGIGKWYSVGELEATKILNDLKEMTKEVDEMERKFEEAIDTIRNFATSQGLEILVCHHYDDC